MYGLLEGVRGGTADSRAAEALRLQEAEAEAARQFRERTMAMQEAQHRLQQEEAGLRLRDVRAVGDARDQIVGLHRREADNAAFLDSGQAGPVQPVDERDFNRAYAGLAIAKGDLGAAQQLRTQSRRMDVSDEAKRLAASPEFQGQVFDYISTKDMFPLKVIPGKTDPKTGKMVSADRLEFDSGYTYDLKQGDRQRIALGVALMKNGFDDEGLKTIEGVNKELRDAIDKANQRAIGMSEFNSRADDRLADNELRAEQIRTQRALRASSGPRAQPEVPPAMLEKYNSLVAEYQQAVDTGNAKRAAEIRQQLPVLQAQMSTVLKRPLSLPEPKQQQEIRANPDGSFIVGGNRLFAPDPKNPGKFVEVNFGPSKLEQWAASRAAAAAYQAGGPPADTPGLTPPNRLPASFETMPLDTLRAYTGTSKEARDVYVRRMAERERLAQDPRFWVRQPDRSAPTELGLDKGY